MAMYNFEPPFHKAKFYDVASCVFDKSSCAAGKKKVAEHSVTQKWWCHKSNLCYKIMEGQGKAFHSTPRLFLSQPQLHKPYS